MIAAGERWPDGSLRPALEDLLGAGAVIAELVESGGEMPSPEAALAAAAYTGTPDPGAAVASSSSGRELRDGGFADDVAVATEVNVSHVVPVLTNGAFADAG